MIRALALILMALPVATPAAAQAVSLPAGCEAYVTVQKRGCTVSTLFVCAADPVGHQRRMDFDEAGMTYAGVIDAETQWIESYHVAADSIERLAPDAADPASLSELMATGRDTWDFATISDDGFETYFRGEDRLTGTTVVIDGVTLDETAFEVVASDPLGRELWRTVGNEYIQREWRTFLSGTRTVTTPDEVFDTDGRPVEFAFPGEDGFLSAEPRYDCSVVMSKGVAR